jgi:hypothetical protein
MTSAQLPPAPGLSAWHRAAAGAAGGWLLLATTLIWLVLGMGMQSSATEKLWSMAFGKRWRKRRTKRRRRQSAGRGRGSRRRRRKSSLASGKMPCLRPCSHTSKLSLGVVLSFRPFPPSVAPSTPSSHAHANASYPIPATPSVISLSQTLPCVCVSVSVSVCVRACACVCTDSAFWMEHRYYNEDCGYFSYTHALDKQPESNLDQIMHYLWHLTRTRFPQAGVFCLLCFCSSLRQPASRASSRASRSALIWLCLL